MIKRFFHQIATDKLQGGVIILVKFLLWILSLLYGILVLLRRLLFKVGILRKVKLLKPVLSIGNLTMGGTGKTPFVEYIAQYLKTKGKHPVILLRGYMAGGKKDQKSDEAQMLQENLSDVPVLVGANRIKSAQDYLTRHQTDTFLLDDGFQHWQLARDLDIVLVSGTNPWGNGALLPRGILREWPNALKRAQVIVITKSNLDKPKVQTIKDRIRLINTKALMIEADHKPVDLMDARSQTPSDLKTIRNENIGVVSSIGDPDSFEKTLIALGANITKHLAFIDHHIYKPEDMVRINKDCHDQGISTIVTTQKDAVKLKDLFANIADDIRIFVLRINTTIHHDEDKLLERIDHLL